MDCLLHVIWLPKLGQSEDQTTDVLKVAYKPPPPSPPPHPPSSTLMHPHVMRKGRLAQIAAVEQALRLELECTTAVSKRKRTKRKRVSVAAVPGGETQAKVAKRSEDGA